MIALQRTFADRTTDVARDFLRSAVVIDDELILAEPARRPAADHEAAPRDPTLEGLPPVVEPSPSERAESARGRLNVQTVVRGFADHGIVCAAIVPTNGDAATHIPRREQGRDLLCWTGTSETIRVRRHTTRSDASATQTVCGWSRSTPRIRRSTRSSARWRISMPPTRLATTTGPRSAPCMS